jgi:hypothetical protein
VWKSHYEDSAKFDGMTNLPALDDLGQESPRRSWGTLALTAPIDVTVTD